MSMYVGMIRLYSYLPTIWVICDANEATSLLSFFRYSVYLGISDIGDGSEHASISFWL